MKDEGLRQLEARARAIAKPNPITGTNGQIVAIEAHAYLTHEHARKEDLDIATLKEILDNTTYGHTMLVLFEHNKSAKLGVVKNWWKSSHQPYAYMQKKRYLADTHLILTPEEHVADKNLFFKVQDAMRRGDVLRVSIGMRNTIQRKLITEVSLVFSGKEPLARMYKLLFSGSQGKEKARVHTDVLEQVMAEETPKPQISETLAKAIANAGGEEAFINAMRAQQEFIETHKRQFDTTKAQQLKAVKASFAEIFPDKTYVKPLLEHFNSSLKDPSTAESLAAFTEFAGDVAKLRSAHVTTKAELETKMKEWAESSQKSTSEAEATKAELEKMRTELARFQGTAQESAKNKRTSNETALAPPPAAKAPALPMAFPKPFAMPGMVEVKQGDAFLTNFFGDIANDPVAQANAAAFVEVFTKEG